MEDLYPFRNLKKKELEEELEARSVEITDETKPKLVEHLNDILHGICRSPALMLKSPTKSSKELYIDDYEILGCEPLHDITNIMQHLIEELPYHIENLEARRDLEKFASNTIGEKNQIKGSDARLYAVIYFCMESCFSHCIFVLFYNIDKTMEYLMKKL